MASRVNDLWRIFRNSQRDQDALEARAARDVLRLIADLRTRLRIEILGTTDWGVNALPDIRRSLDLIVNNWRSEWIDKLNGYSSAAWDSGEAAMSAQMQMLGGMAAYGVTIGVGDVLKRRMLSGLATDLITNITEETRGRITAQLSMAVLGERTSTQAMQDIEQTLGIEAKGARGIAYRAERIVRTEISRAYSTAAHMNIQEAERYNEGARKRWVASMDERTRDTHLAAHGQERRVNEPFVVGGALLMHPGDPSGPPEETINCRCSEVLWVPDWGDFDKWFPKTRVE